GKRAIRNRRLASALPITRWPRQSASALRANAQQSTVIQPRDGTAARANAAHVDGWKASHMTEEWRSKPGFRRPRDAPVANQADVIAGASSISYDHIGAGRIVASSMTRGDWRYAWPRFHQMDRSF